MTSENGAWATAGGGGGARDEETSLRAHLPVWPRPSLAPETVGLTLHFVQDRGPAQCQPPSPPGKGGQRLDGGAQVCWGSVHFQKCLDRLQPSAQMGLVGRAACEGGAPSVGGGAPTSLPRGLCPGRGPKLSEALCGPRVALSWEGGHRSHLPHPALPVPFWGGGRVQAQVAGDWGGGPRGRGGAMAECDPPPTSRPSPRLSSIPSALPCPQASTGGPEAYAWGPGLSGASLQKPSPYPQQSWSREVGGNGVW